MNKDRGIGARVAGAGARCSNRCAIPAPCRNGTIISLIISLNGLISLISLIVSLRIIPVTGERDGM